MIDFDNQTQIDIPLELFMPIFEHLSSGSSLELILVSDEKIKEINREHRGINKPTDVLSFPIKNSKTNFLGSLLISVDTAKRVSDELGVELEDELQTLFLHGMLHLLGFDHESDNGEMREKELEIAHKLGIKSTLISR